MSRSNEQALENLIRHLPEIVTYDIDGVYQHAGTNGIECLVVDGKFSFLGHTNDPESLEEIFKALAKIHEDVERKKLGVLPGFAMVLPYSEDTSSIDVFLEDLSDELKNAFTDTIAKIIAMESDYLLWEVDLAAIEGEALEFA